MTSLRTQIEGAMTRVLDRNHRALSPRTLRLLSGAATDLVAAMLGKTRTERDQARADLDTAERREEDIGRRHNGLLAQLDAERARVDHLLAALDQGHCMIAGLLGQWINGETGHPGYEARRPRWMASTELQRRADDMAAWRESWRVTDPDARPSPMLPLRSEPTQDELAAIRTALESGRYLACDGEETARLPTCEPCDGTGKRFEWDDLPDCPDCEGLGKVRETPAPADVESTTGAYSVLHGGNGVLVPPRGTPDFDEWARLHPNDPDAQPAEPTAITDAIRAHAHTLATNARTVADMFDGLAAPVTIPREMLGPIPPTIGALVHDALARQDDRHDG